MKLSDLLTEQDLCELGPTPMAPPSLPNAQQSPAVNQQFNPKVQTALVAQQQQDKIKQRRAIQDQITALTKQISDLRKQLTDLG
jgi:hypothetical protein